MSDEALFKALGQIVADCRAQLAKGSVGVYYLSSALRNSIKASLSVIGDIDVGNYLTNLYKAANNPVDAAAPTVPTGLVVTPLSATSLRVTWNQSSDGPQGTGVGGYILYVNAVPLDEVSAFTLTYDIPALNPSTAYSVTLRAFDRALPVRNVSDPCAAVVGTTNASSGDTTPPSVPTGLTVTAINSTSLHLTWDASVDAASGVKDYGVYKGGVFQRYVTSLSDDLTGLTASTAYSITVTARDNASPPNESAQCTPVVGTTFSDQPGYAVRVRAGNDASYTDPSGNVWAADNGFAGGTKLVWGSTLQILQTVNPTLYLSEHYGSTLVYTAAVPNGTYQVQLFFCENYINSTWPNGGVGQRLFNITIQGVLKTSNYDVFATAGAANTPANKLYTGIVVTNSTLTITLTGVVQNAFVNAIEIVGTGGAVTDQVAPTIPTGLIATPVDTQSVQLVWNASSDSGTGVGGYNIYRGGVPIGTSASDTTSFTDSGLSAGTLYSYQVDAFDKALVVNTSAKTGAVTATTKTATGSGSNIKGIYRFPWSQPQWDQALQLPAGSVIFPIFDANNENFDTPPPTGPAGTINPLITANIAAAHAAGLYVLGHVNGAITQRTIAEIKHVIDGWYSACPTLDGIMVGSGGYFGGTIPDGKATYAAYWKEIADYIKTKPGAHKCFIHVSDDTFPSSVVTASDRQAILSDWDTIVIYEDSVQYNGSNPVLPALESWYTSYDRSKFAALAINVNSTVRASVESHFIAKGVGFLLLSAVDTGANSSVTEDPTYWSNFISGLTTTGTQLASPGPLTLILSNTQPYLIWTAVTGALGYEIFRDGSSLITVGSGTTSYNDSGRPYGVSVSYDVRAVGSGGATSAFAGAQSITPVAATGGGSDIYSPDGIAGWQMLPAGQTNRLGGRRDLRKHPFTLDSFQNTPNGTGATLADTYIRTVPEDGDTFILNGERMFQDYTHYNSGWEPVSGLQTFGAAACIPWMDHTKPLVGVRQNKNADFDQNAPQRCQAEGNTDLWSAPWDPNIYIEGSAHDSHAQFLLNVNNAPDFVPGDTTYECGYFFRCQSQGGVAVSGNVSPSRGSISSNGMYEGSHGAARGTALMGQMRAGEGIPLGATVTINGTQVKGLGPARHPIALDVATIWMAITQEAGQPGPWPRSSYNLDANVGWMHLMRYLRRTNWLLAVEYEAYGMRYLQNVLGPATTGAITALRMGCRVMLNPALDPFNMGLETEAMKYYAWTFKYYGGVPLDTTPGTLVSPYVELLPGTPYDFVGVWERHWGLTHSSRPNQGPNNTGTAVGRDWDRIMRSLKVVTNSQPGQWGGGGTPLCDPTPL